MVEDEIMHLRDQRNTLSRANHKSDKIVNNARKNKLSEIFDRLDGDRDGQISSMNIDKDAIAP